MMASMEKLRATNEQILEWKLIQANKIADLEVSLAKKARKIATGFKIETRCVANRRLLKRLVVHRYVTDFQMEKKCRELSESLTKLTQHLLLDKETKRAAYMAEDVTAESWHRKSALMSRRSPMDIRKKAIAKIRSDRVQL